MITFIYYRTDHRRVGAEYKYLIASCELRVIEQEKQEASRQQAEVALLFIKDPITSSGSQDMTKEDISTLRVAHAELNSGKVAGRVFVRLSEGAAAILTDRPVAQARIERKIRKELADNPVVPSEKNLATT